MIDEVLVVLVRAMVERFESKGVVDIPVEYRQQSKSKRVSVVWYIAKNNEYKLNSKYRYFHDTGIDTVARIASHRWILYWMYMNRSRCQEDMDRWATRFDIGIFGQRMGGRCQSVSCGCPVLRRGGGVLD